MRGRCSMCAHNSFNKQGEPLVWCALSAVLFRIHLALDLALSWKVLFEDAVHHGNHFNKSRPSQVQQTHCIHTSENAEEITIDQCKGNKNPCVAHMLVVFLVYFSALSESETARLIASNDASIVKHGQGCRSLINFYKSKTVE